jgi:hypothetical protein
MALIVIPSSQRAKGYCEAYPCIDCRALFARAAQGDRAGQWRNESREVIGHFEFVDEAGASARLRYTFDKSCRAGAWEGEMLLHERARTLDNR